MTLYSPSFTANPRYAVNVEYNMPSEWGYLTSRSSVMRAAPPDCRSPWPTVRVAHSPTPSAVRIAARGVGAVRKAAAACAWWCPVNRIFELGTPRCDAMMPRTHTFSPSELLIAWGNDRHERGNVRS